MNKLNHLAIIMDGNGRWAKKHGFLRSSGHENGAQVVQKIAEFCLKENIKNLTLYAFSTENWKRPKKEVDFLMTLLKKFLRQKSDDFIKNGIKFHTIGDIDALNDELKFEISNLKSQTKNNTRLNLVLAINYGSKNEVIRAIKKIVANKDVISEESIGSYLDTNEFGDVDLLIRTGGETRLSNFLLWQSSYAELHFTSTLWPDFNEIELKKIVEIYRLKHRKFGGI